MTITLLRKSMPLLSPLAAGLIFMGGLLGSLGAAPAAHADSNDNAFIAALNAKDITYESRAAAIGAGHLVCHDLDLGQTPEQVATDVLQSSDMDSYHAGYFVGASIRAFCPQYVSQG
jgi:hypothetical protein